MLVAMKATKIAKERESRFLEKYNTTKNNNV